MNVRTVLVAAGIALASVIGSTAVASAAPVPNCGEWSHPVLISPTQWGCSSDIAPGRHHHWEHVVLDRR